MRRILRDPMAKYKASELIRKLVEADRVGRDYNLHGAIVKIFTEDTMAKYRMVLVEKDFTKLKE